MNFNSLQYLLFLPLCLLCVFITPKKAKNVVLLIASLCFYLSAGTPLYILFLLFGCAVTFIGGHIIQKVSTSKKGFIVAAAIIIQVLVLCFFKFNSVFFPNLAQAFSNINLLYTAENSARFSILAPLGISYYTFSSISYLVDIKRNKITAEKSFLKTSLYLSFFPYIVAGPIARADKILPQLDNSYTFEYNKVAGSLKIMLYGFFKKIAVADILSKYINTIYADVNSYSNGFTFIFLILLYMVYLYCDFSGYSDIAFASAKLLGIEICENFRTPLFSKSIKEFWRRWHISLSSWLREYIYIPLGGSRCSKPRCLTNIMLTFVFSGIWHGCGVNFIIWGALHGVYQCVENIISNINILKNKKFDLIKNIFKTVFVYYLVAISFVFFRSATLADATSVLTNQFKNLSLQGFITETVAIISKGFDSMPLLVFMFILFSFITISITVFFDAVSYYKKNDLHPAIIISMQKPIIRWGIYYLLVMLIFVAFLMQNGNYVGNVSFAYANF